MAVLLGERLLPVRQIGIERSRFMGKRSINGRTKGALCLVLLILGCAERMPVRTGPGTVSAVFGRAGDRTRCRGFKLVHQLLLVCNGLGRQ